MSKTSYIFVSGGVISGIGKGVTAASIGALLKSRGYKVTIVKCDAYLNVDAGTIRPQEHGEVFVTIDGEECDQDIGHYERFLHEDLLEENYVTNGKLYQEIIRKERNLEYDGEDVEVVLHVPEELIRRIKLAEKKTKAEIVIIEIGGTVGEYQNILFIETNKIMKFKYKENVLHIHVGYLPIPKHLGEMKSKPIQNSVRILNSSGIQPDFIVGRSEKRIDKPRKDRIEWFCNVDRGSVISNHDTESIYEVPLTFVEQEFDLKILRKLGLKPKSKDMKEWKDLVERIRSKDLKKIKIAVVGKYFGIGEYELSDSYISVVEAVKHASWKLGVDSSMTWIESEKFEKDPKSVKVLSDYDAVIVPGGFGSRGVEGIISAIKYTRENKIPYLGLCYGMQLAVVEFARNVLGLKNAHTTEVKKGTKHPVIDIMENQKKHMDNHLYGGTMRLGNWKAKLSKKSIVYDWYKKAKLVNTRSIIYERHRHRFEFNNKYLSRFTKNGAQFNAVNPDTKLIELFELDKKMHPFFIGSQYHPEMASKPMEPHPLFLGLIENALGKKK